MKIKNLMIVGSMLITTMVFAKANTNQVQFVQADSANVAWKDMPNLPGVKYAVLSGDPTKKAFFVTRVKFPANYSISPHYHSNYQTETVISGTYYYGDGKKINVAKGVTLPAGSFFIVPPKSIHYSWTKEETVLQISGVGPWGAVYLKSENKST